MDIACSKMKVEDRTSGCGVAISDYGSHVIGPQKFMTSAYPLAKNAVGK